MQTRNFHILSGETISDEIKSPPTAEWLEVIGWIGIVLSALASIFGCMDGTEAIVASGFGGVIASALILGVSVVIDRLHRIELHLRAAGRW
jgi:hypothetical protein